MNSDTVFALEKELQFKTFNHHDGLAIALKINNKVLNEGLKSVGIRIVYNGLLIFHYLMDNRKESPWLNHKEKTVLESGHSSLYVFTQRNKYQDWLEDDTYAICGGGFPIIVNNEVKGAICVSGLEHTEDHRLIIESIREYLTEENNT